MLKHYDIEQNTPEWFDMRAGKLTMSKLGCVMASAREYIAVCLSSTEYGVLNVSTKKVYKKTYGNLKDAESFAIEQRIKNDSKEFSDLAKKYAIDLAVEQITGKPIISSYSNDDMSEGHIREPIAISRYERETFCTVERGGFFCNDMIGYSPDGLPGDGLIEVKSSITTAAHFERIKKQAVDSAYKWQCIGGLKYTKKPWLDFASHCLDFPEDMQLFLLRVYYNDFLDEFKMIDERVVLFFELVAETKDTILNSDYFIQGK